ncbi:sugar transferase [Flavobacterium qiangtangense]|uniref:Sugar transferase n=1 Tax=Flavobacterium qiangtangense TaxID=1442595 RepID=A0ABW1PRM8_9FLAO
MVKRNFDFFFSLAGLIILSLPMLLILVLLMIDTSSNGFFLQYRVGQHAKLFKIYKFKTVISKTRKISTFGKLLRKYKIDELPQLFNVLIGDMSFVGPRPDLPGYYDKLHGEERNILKLKPGITSEASIKYRNEEAILKKEKQPLEYNDSVIFPDKVKMNLDYYYNRTFLGDIKIIINTFIKY